MEPMLARDLWHRLEPLNAATYFSPECRQATDGLGMRGFWMGYFACRAAPLGPVVPAVVEATFYNFHPDRVGRALPDAWGIAPPETVLDARVTAAAAALRRLLPDGVAERAATSCRDELAEVVRAGSTSGRTLFAANAALELPDDPVGALWQLATALREHRGDGHVALLRSEDLDGCEVLVLFAAGGGAPGDLLQRSRGWSDDEWRAATGRLAERDLMAGGALTPEGRRLRERVEARTDELALAPYRVLGDERVAALLDRLDGPARAIAAAGEISYPNPMGLPPPG